MAVQWYFYQRCLLQHKAIKLFELAAGAFDFQLLENKTFKAV